MLLKLKNTQCLKVIARRSKIVYKNNEIEQSISSKILYSYLDKSNEKKRYRIKNYRKRQNGISISQRPKSINQI